MSAVCIGAAFQVREEMCPLPTCGRSAQRLMHTFDATTDVARRTDVAHIKAILQRAGVATARQRSTQPMQ